MAVSEKPFLEKGSIDRLRDRQNWGKTRPHSILIYQAPAS